MQVLFCSMVTAQIDVHQNHSRAWLDCSIVHSIVVDLCHFALSVCALTVSSFCTVAYYTFCFYCVRKWTDESLWKVSVNMWVGKPAHIFCTALHALVHAELRITCTVRMLRALPKISMWYFKFYNAKSKWVGKLKKKEVPNHCNIVTV